MSYSLAVVRSFLVITEAGIFKECSWPGNPDLLGPFKNVKPLRWVENKYIFANIGNYYDYLIKVTNPSIY